MNYFKTGIILTSLVLTCTIFSFAQAIVPPEPRQEKLLNGLKLLIWNDPKADKVSVKVRVHSGTAFDPKDKMGTMALLADILFPTEQSKEFFTEELDGSLEVVSNYDYIQINATGKPDALQTILETLATAVTNTQLTPENFAIVRDARLQRILELEKNPAYLADRAAARRLFGDLYPYGRSPEGTPASLKKIDRFDLVNAREKFFTADNATLAVSGNVKPDFVYKASRQLFGAWKKSESKVPATFRQPDAPDTRELVIDSPSLSKIEMRLAVATTTSRSSKDFYAAQILNFIWQKAFCLDDQNTFGKLSYQPYLLRGVYQLRRSFEPNVAMVVNTNSRCLNSQPKNGKFTYPSINQNDFDAAKKALTFNYQQITRNVSDLADLWFDIDTYKLVSVKDELSKLTNVTFADVQRINADLQQQPMITVTLRKPETAQQ